MARLQTHRGPVQRRIWVPDVAAPQDDRRLVARVEAYERGPDVSLDVYVGVYRAGTLVVPRDEEQAMVRRLFGEVAPAVDRAAFQAMLQGFEDAVASQDARAVIAAWRLCMGAFETMARDLEALVPRPADTERAS